MVLEGFPGGTSGKEPTCQCRRFKRREFDPWVGKLPWRREWQPTPVFLPGESHGQKSLWATVHRVAKSQTQLKRLSTHACKWLESSKWQGQQSWLCNLLYRITKNFTTLEFRPGRQWYFPCLEVKQLARGRWIERGCLAS